MRRIASRLPVANFMICGVDGGAPAEARANLTKPHQLSTLIARKQPPIDHGHHVRSSVLLIPFCELNGGPIRPSWATLSPFVRHPVVGHHLSNPPHLLHALVVPCCNFQALFEGNEDILAQHIGALQIKHS